VRGMLTRRKIHFALLSADPDALARTWLLFVLFGSHTAENITLSRMAFIPSPFHSAQQTSIFHLCNINKTKQTKQHNYFIR
jgi:hypothetical protein